MTSIHLAFVELGKIPMMSNENDYFVKLKNSAQSPYECVIKYVVKNSICQMYKIIFTNFVKHTDIKIVYKDLERLNKRIPIGHFYYEPESKEIRFIINTYVGYMDKHEDYLTTLLKYGMCIYGEYYMMDCDIGEYSNVDESVIDDYLSLKYFFMNIATIEKIYKPKVKYSKETILGILNGLNMKANLAEALWKDNRIVVRLSVCKDSIYMAECMEHIEDHLSHISCLLK